MKRIEVSEQLSRMEVGKLIGRKSFTDKAALDAVRKIIADVRENGDAAVTKYTKEFDQVRLNHDQFEVTTTEIEQASNEVEKDLLAALKLVINNVTAYCERDLPSSWVSNPEGGAQVGEQVVPLSRVGIYVPGGRAAYPTTVIMNAAPARVAGVGEIVMCVPPGHDGKINAAVLVAASELKVDRIFKVGGAQAIAAMAYGTGTIPAVDKITGPGNIYVALAKREVYGDVGIDMLAGPSEVVIIADDSANPEFVAADMLAQAEHDPEALSILITDSSDLIDTVAGLVDQSNTVALIARNIDEAVKISNTIAPEHLELMCKYADQLVGKIVNAGAIFIGSYSPTALGDYIAGPNHTLPTGGTARFSSPLGVYDFVKRSSVISYTPKALRDVADSISTLAEAEGLIEHAKSIRLRKENG